MGVCTEGERGVKQGEKNCIGGQIWGLIVIAIIGKA
jgi:hypothetical protein